MTEDILIGKQYFPTCLCENKKYTWAWGKGLWQMDTRYTWHQNVCHKKNLVLWFVCSCVFVKSFHKDFRSPDLWSRDFCSLTFDICPVEKDFCSQVDFRSPKDFCSLDFCSQADVCSLDSCSSENFCFLEDLYSLEFEVHLDHN